MPKPYKEGTPYQQIIIDGWSRGFDPQQTVDELKIMGYQMSLEDCTLAFSICEEAYLEDVQEPSPSTPTPVDFSSCMH